MFSDHVDCRLMSRRTFLQMKKEKLDSMFKTNDHVSRESDRKFFSCDQQIGLEILS